VALALRAEILAHPTAAAQSAEPAKPADGLVARDELRLLTEVVLGLVAYVAGDLDRAAAAAQDACRLRAHRLPALAASVLRLLGAGR
jgi:ATP/maltotriose-dependent transcriptional regulator MalT